MARRTRPGLKTLDDALAIRAQVLLAFERAERATSGDERRRSLTFVIVGGGPTGVELAGAIVEIARHALRHEFRAIDSRTATVLLLEGGPDVLPAFPQDLRDRARQDLERLGVTVRTGATVERIEHGVVHIGDERLEAGTILWAAGVQASPLGATLGVPLDRAGRVKVEPDLSVPGAPSIFVVGDLATLDGPQRASRCRAWRGRDPGGAPRRRRHRGRSRRAAARDVPLSQPRRPRDHRPRRRRRRSGLDPLRRLDGVAVLAVRPHPQAHRLPQPAGGARPVGVGLRRRSSAASG